MTKIMLAEDDPGMLYLLKTLLGLEGFTVASLPDNMSILDAIRAEAPDALLLDVHLANNANGMDVLRDLRSSADLNKLVVIMASGMSLEAEARAAGANAFLLKPYMPEDLISAIRKFVS